MLCYASLLYCIMLQYNMLYYLTLAFALSLSLACAAAPPRQHRQSEGIRPILTPRIWDSRGLPQPFSRHYPQDPLTPLREGGILPANHARTIFSGQKKHALQRGA